MALPITYNEALKVVTDRFANELKRLHDRVESWEKYHEIHLNVDMKYSPDTGAVFKFAWSRGSFGSERVEAADLERLMTEVWRRQGFDEHERNAIGRRVLEAPVEAEAEVLQITDAS